MLFWIHCLVLMGLLLLLSSGGVFCLYVDTVGLISLQLSTGHFLAVVIILSTVSFSSLNLIVFLFFDFSHSFISFPLMLLSLISKACLHFSISSSFVLLTLKWVDKEENINKNVLTWKSAKTGLWRRYEF